MKRTKAVFGCVAWALAACGGPGGSDGGNDAMTTTDVTGIHTRGDATGDTTPPTDVPTGIDAIAPSDVSTAACPAAALGARLGRSRFLVGGAMEDAQFAMVPFDVRYRYLAGDVPAAGPCASCASGCTVNGTSCANSGPGCPWWGCWQYDVPPPGRYVADHITATRAANAIPMISYYVWFTVAGSVEAAPEIAALNDGARVRRYLADWRFVCTTVGATDTGPVILHVEPDLWGFAQQVNNDPSAIPAAVSAAGLTECAGLPDTVAGFARCMLRIARTNAPHALVGFHASAWGAGDDALYTTQSGFDVNAHADRTAAFMRALGANEGDLVVVEMSDRDSGFNHRWFDETNATVPNFTRALAWQSRLSQSIALPALYWQIPYGHRGLPNTCDRYEDNRVDYFFAHAGEFAASGALGIAFGAGATCQTNPATDDGFFLSHAASYFSGTRPCLCGPAACP